MKTWKVWADGDEEPAEPNVEITIHAFDSDEDAAAQWATDLYNAGAYAGGEYPDREDVNVRSPSGVLTRLTLTTEWSSPTFVAYEVK